MAGFARELERELNEVMESFRHIHVNNGKDDGCKKCGLDLRHEIHERVTEQQNKGQPTSENCPKWESTV